MADILDLPVAPSSSSDELPLHAPEELAMQEPHSQSDGEDALATVWNGQQLRVGDIAPQARPIAGSSSRRHPARLSRVLWHCQFAGSH